MMGEVGAEGEMKEWTSCIQKIKWAHLSWEKATLQHAAAQCWKKAEWPRRGSLVQTHRHSHSVSDATHTSESFCFTLAWTWEDILTQLSLATHSSKTELESRCVEPPPCVPESCLELREQYLFTTVLTKLNKQRKEEKIQKWEQNLGVG